MTFGQGLEEDETISSRLEQILKVPVINLGVRGSSITFSVYNQILLKEINCKPKAIINLWTNAARIVYFQNNLARHLGSWTTKTEKNQYTYYSSWSYDQSNMDTSNKLNRKIAKLIWHDVPHIEASYFPDTIKLLDIQGLIQVDNSLSGRHPGPKTAIITAEYLSNEYKNLV
jgi:hypothetical protein